MNFPSSCFLSSDMNLQGLQCKHVIFFIFFFPTSQNIPCRDLSTVEYTSYTPPAINIFALEISKNRQAVGSILLALMIVESGLP